MVCTYPSPAVGLAGHKKDKHQRRKKVNYGQAEYLPVDSLVLLYQVHVTEHLS